MELGKPRAEVIVKLVDGAFDGMMTVVRAEPTSAAEVVSAGMTIAQRCIAFALSTGDVEHNRKVMVSKLQHMLLELADTNGPTQ